MYIHVYKLRSQEKVLPRLTWRASKTLIFKNTHNCLERDSQNLQVRSPSFFPDGSNNEYLSSFNEPLWHSHTDDWTGENIICDQMPGAGCCSQNVLNMYKDTIMLVNAFEGI